MSLLIQLLSKARYTKPDHETVHIHFMMQYVVVQSFCLSVQKPYIKVTVHLKNPIMCHQDALGNILHNMLRYLAERQKAMVYMCNYLIFLLPAYSCSDKYSTLTKTKAFN